MVIFTAANIYEYLTSVVLCYVVYGLLLLFVDCLYSSYFRPSFLNSVLCTYCKQVFDIYPDFHKCSVITILLQFGFPGNPHFDLHMHNDSLFREDAMYFKYLAIRYFSLINNLDLLCFVLFHEFEQKCLMASKQ